MAIDHSVGTAVPETAIRFKAGMFFFAEFDILSSSSHGYGYECKRGDTAVTPYLPS
jgi:hypothetical protein